MPDNNISGGMTCTKSTLERVSVHANAIYWETHSLLHACKLIAAELDDDYLELKELLCMASMKALEMQSCFNEYLPTKEVSHV